MTYTVTSPKIKLTLIILILVFIIAASSYFLSNKNLKGSIKSTPINSREATSFRLNSYPKDVNSNLRANLESNNRNILNFKGNTLDLEKQLEIRNKNLAQLMQTNPDEITKFTLSSDLREKLPENLKQNIETQRTIEGNLNIIHSDDIANRKARYYYFIHTSDNEDIQLYTTKLFDNKFKPNTKISAAGIYLKGVGIAVKKTDIKVSTPATDKIFTTPDIGKMLIIPIYTTQESITISNQDIQNAFFADTNSVKAYFAKNSYGAVQLSGDIYSNPIAVSNSGSPEIQEVITQADPEENYHTYFLVAIDHPQLDFSGFATLGWRNNIWFSNGEIRNIAFGYFGGWEQINLANITHEVGHILGLDHAAAYDPTNIYGNNIYPSICTPDIPLPSDNFSAQDCSAVYGDNSVMGAGKKDLSPYQQKKLGAKFLSKNITNDGQFSIDSFTNSPAKSSYKEMTIPAINGHYSFQYRTPDFTKEEKKASFPGSKAVSPDSTKEGEKAWSMDGLIVRFVPNKNSNILDNDMFAPTNDLNFPQNTFADTYTIFSESNLPGFLKGNIFTDKSRNIKVEVLDTAQDHVSLNISIGEPMDAIIPYPPKKKIP